MRPNLAIAMLSIASRSLSPMPRGFMPLWVLGIAVDEVPCLVDEQMPPTGDVYSLDVFGDGRRAVIGHPVSWAARGAFNLATAFRPEGLAA